VRGRAAVETRGAASGETGEYIVRLYINEFGQVGGSLGTLDAYGMLPWVLETTDKGFPPGEGHTWRKVDVVVNGRKGLQIRARQGYYME
jgi:hypothetical protein